MFSCSNKEEIAPVYNPDVVPTTVVKGKIRSNSTYNIESSEILSLSNISTVFADGTAEVAYNKGIQNLTYLYDAHGNLILAGFLSDDKKEISPESTAEYLLYMERTKKNKILHQDFGPGKSKAVHVTKAENTKRARLLMKTIALDFISLQFQT